MDEKYSVEQLINRLRLLEIDHDPDCWPAVQMKDISALCDVIENARLEKGGGKVSSLLDCYEV